MPRSQNKVASHRRRKRVLKSAKGYWGARSKVYTIAKHHVEKDCNMLIVIEKQKSNFSTIVDYKN